MPSTVPTKLRVPELGTNLVVRPSLTRLLNDGLRRTLTLVSAPAGYGKTTAVAMWVHSLADRPSHACHVETRSGPRIAWYSLDPEDNDVNVFFARFTAAIDAASPGALQTAAAALAVQELPINEYANTLAEACLQLLQPVVLVLDDYHLITEPGIHAVLLHLIQYASARLHLVIVTRHDPPLRIARLRAQNQLAELRLADLRLTELEAQELLQTRLTQRPSVELVTELQSHTEGWVAGLQLAATAIQGHDDPDAFVADFQHHDTLYVMDYLVDEVLDQQTDEVKDFLLKTALLVQFHVQLAAEVTGRDIPACSRILNQLRQENLFIVALDSQGGWYRYHHQFHAMLADRALLALSTGAADSIRGDAIEWLAGHGWIDEALTQAITGKLWQRAADLVEADRYRLQNREEWHLLWQRIEQLPEEVVAQRPGLILAQAWVLQVHDRIVAIPPLVDQAEVLLAAAGALSGETLQGEIYALRGSWVYAKESSEQRIDFLYRAMTLLPRHACVWVRGFVYINLAVLLATQGQREAALKVIIQEIEGAGPGELVYLTRLHHALAAVFYCDGTAGELLECGLRFCELASRAMMPMSLAWARYAVGWAHYQRNEPTLALEALLSVLDHPYSVHLELMILALAAMVPVAAELGREDQVSRLIGQASRIALERGNIAAADELAALAAHAALMRHDDNAAWDWAERFVQSGFRSIAGQRRSPDVSMRVPIFARIVLASDFTATVPQAVALLEAYVRQNQALNKAHFVQGAVLLASCHWRLGQSGQAVQAMQLAVNVGWPRGFRRAFLEHGTAVPSLLYAMIQGGLSADAAARVLAQCEAWTVRNQGGVSEVERISDSGITLLSEREAEVLALLAQQLSNKEIARALHVSPHTVRNHTSNIYGKLHVASRRQAVAQAQALGLLPPNPRLPFP